MRTKTSFRMAAAAAALVLFATACGGGDDDDGDEGTGGSGTQGDVEAGGEFSVSLGDATFLSPAGACYESECSLVLSVLMEPLWEVDAETGELTMRAAESIESDDQQTWTVKLKPDQTFHNGEPVNADAYIRAWNTTALGGNAQATNGFFVKVQGYADMNPTDPNPEDDKTPKPKATELSGLKKVDDLTIEITLDAPFSQWPLLMSYTPAFAPLSEECADITACADNPIGTGPYQMAEPWKRDRTITVETFPDYAGDDGGNAETIVFMQYKDLAAAYKDYQAGNIDLVNLLPDVLPDARQNFPDLLLEEESSSFTYMGFPLDDPKFQSPEIRHAISMAFDREAIADKVLNNAVIPGDDVISPVVPGYQEGACEYCVYDPEQAKELWDANGGDQITDLRLFLNAGAGHEPWVEAMGNQIEANLGAKFEMVPLEWAEYLEFLDAGDFDGPFRLGWLMDYPSPENYLTPMYTPAGGSNYTGYQSDEFEAALEEANAAPSIEEGVDGYRAAADIVLEDLPLMPISFGVEQWVFSENIHNVELDAQETVLLRDVAVLQ